jgi:cytochrome c oxidase subunit 3
MSNFIKKLFGTLAEKPWEKEQAAIDTYHPGKTFNLSLQTSAVIVIFSVSTVLFSLILTGYLYTMPPEQDIKFLFKPNLLWVNTIVLFFVTYFFSKIKKDLKKNDTTKIKKNLILVGGLSYLFLFGQTFFWYQLMQDEKFVTTNTYFSSFYIFTAIHGLHLLGGLFFWGKVCSKTLKLKQNEIISQKKSISALSLYWTFLLIVWLIFFLTIYVFNDTVIAWCKALLT